MTTGGIHIEEEVIESLDSRIEDLFEFCGENEVPLSLLEQAIVTRCLFAKVDHYLDMQVMTGKMN